ncbi:hypothetical protein [Stigmatella aurantiaca]|uniref:Uncharacterized protein n=1 Tax=Stigmatella aurantiaca (strain DW4/3-1) TaxID=378806 RepID=Q096L2_STIAD|nr:hypothetical protein [Stigmatella aurantiaca]ADO68695.1 uncharacterized protein STAUR_0891 [Stigmatella aurantiaca DW4/3-1]EAU67654.1 hypothetical protein STIAU_0596 [Stigmatella aurantiaca DW4/3-1]
MAKIESGEIQKLNAVEAKKRELRVRVARIRGQLDASAAATKFFARVNQDTQIQKEEAEAELRALEESGSSGITDGWGEFTAVDGIAKGERRAGALKGYGWLVLNPQGEVAEFVAAVETGLHEHATAGGRSVPLQRGGQLVALWVCCTYEAKKSEAPSWEAFRAALLTAPEPESVLVCMAPV